MNRKNTGLFVGFLILFTMFLIPTTILFNQKPVDNYYSEVNNFYYNQTTIVYQNETIPEPIPELVSYPIVKDEFEFYFNGSVYKTWNYTYYATNFYRIFLMINQISNASYFTTEISIYDSEHYNTDLEYRSKHYTFNSGSTNYYRFEFDYAATWLIIFETYGSYWYYNYVAMVQYNLTHQVKEIWLAK